MLPLLVSRRARAVLPPFPFTCSIQSRSCAHCFCRSGSAVKGSSAGPGSCLRVSENVACPRPVPSPRSDFDTLPQDAVGSAGCVLWIIVCDKRMEGSGMSCVKGQTSMTRLHAEHSCQRAGFSGRQAYLYGILLGVGEAAWRWIQTVSKDYSVVGSRLQPPMAWWAVKS